MRRVATGVSVFGLLVLIAGLGHAQEQGPPIPVGLDAYRLWHLWPMQRIGVRAYMRSTYDRTGGNRSADASHFLYQENDAFNVTLDVEGRGVLYFARYNHWHGSPWHYEVDGRAHVVQESSTPNPDEPTEGSVFMPEHLFPNPLTWTWSVTKGADLMWVPLAFERSFRMAYTRTHYGTGYYIYHLYPPDLHLSRPLQAWTGTETPDPDVLDLLARAGTDIAPQDIVRIAGQARFEKGAVVLVELDGGPAMVRALKLDVPRDQAQALGRARLRVTWDGRAEPSIDAPVALFFGAGTLFNRDDREYLVKALPVNIRFAGERVHLACYFPMPCFRSARFEIVGAEGVEDLRWELRHESYDGPASAVGYFHATHRRHGLPEPGRDLVFLDTRGQEGAEEWSGSFVGTSFIFTRDAVLTTLEGDPRFFFDDSMTPQAYGTGTEEWGGGGDYWGGRTMTLPLAGHPCGVAKREDALNEEDLIHSAYRFLLADLMPFGRNAVIRFEHGGTNQSKEEYESVTYWYGLPAPSLVLTDELDVGDGASEDAHRYRSPQASDPVTVRSRYEWGVDRLEEAGDHADLVPEFDKTGRHTPGVSEFTVRLRSDNRGVLLRRTLDYRFPNQRAEVYVADVAEDGEAAAWQRAGVWYLAGSNTCVFSNPPEELGATQHEPVTSNRWLRDDEFLVARSLTQGRDSIRVRIVFTPVERPLFPGHPVPDLAWSELDYRVYCYVEPSFEVPPPSWP